MLYLQAFRERGQWQTCQFFQELRCLYGRWAREAVVNNGGPWYQGALRQLRQTERVHLAGGIRNYMECFFQELKRRLQRKLGLTSVCHWLDLYAWHYNRSSQQGAEGYHKAVANSLLLLLLAFHT